MFYLVHVPEKHQDYLRFVWWPGGDLSKEPIDHQMCVHLIGATSSPSCFNYAPRKTAEIYKKQFGEETAHVLSCHFYVDVDDMLKSLITAKMQKRKFHSNDRETLSIIQDKSKQLKNVDISTRLIPEERPLGMNWCPESDKFIFKIQLKEKPMTRRGVLSTISTIYDPLGIAGPYLLEGKKILLQQICTKKEWDDLLTIQKIKLVGEVFEQLDILKLLKNFCLERCLYPGSFGEIVHLS